MSSKWLEESGNTSIIFSPNLTHNLTELSQSRNLAAVLIGVFAGILKVEGYWLGGLVYVFGMLLSSFIVVTKISLAQGASLKSSSSTWRDKLDECFVSKRSVFTTDIFGGIMSYILTWTLVYCIVHVF